MRRIWGSFRGWGVLAAVLVLARGAEGVTDEELKGVGRKVEALLRGELKGRWYPGAMDKELGGFHQNFGRDWKAEPDTDRFLVYQARMTWTAAAFANYSEGDREEFAGYAKYGVEFLDRVMRDKELGGFHWILGRDGEVDLSLGTDKHVYGTAFVLYAASEVYRVTKDETARRVARDAFAWLEKHGHDGENGGYFEALTREGKPILGFDAGAPIGKRTDRLGVYYGFKTMNSHIHLLEAIAGYYRAQPSEDVKGRLAEMLAIIRDRVAVAPGALNLYMTRDWRAAPAHDSFGHDVEAGYLLVEAAEALGVPGDPATWKMARLLVDHALDWGWDEEHGGFYDKGDVFGSPAYDRTKVWWTQAEGLNALLFMHKTYRSETDRYGKAFLKQWGFIEKHQVDLKSGGWFMETTREGSLIGDGRKATAWKANYHTSRALMNVGRLIGEMTR